MPNDECSHSWSALSNRLKFFRSAVLSAPDIVCVGRFWFDQEEYPGTVINLKNRETKHAINLDLSAQPLYDAWTKSSAALLRVEGEIARLQTAQAVQDDLLGEPDPYVEQIETMMPMLAEVQDKVST